MILCLEFQPLGLEILEMGSNNYVTEGVLYTMARGDLLTSQWMAFLGGIHLILSLPRRNYCNDLVLTVVVDSGHRTCSGNIVNGAVAKSCAVVSKSCAVVKSVRVGSRKKINHH